MASNKEFPVNEVEPEECCKVTLLFPLYRRWVCEDFPDFKPVMEDILLNGYDTKRFVVALSFIGNVISKFSFFLQLRQYESFGRQVQRDHRQYSPFGKLQPLPES